MSAATNLQQSVILLRDDTGWAATSCGILSAVGYMLANVCLRSVTELDPFWVSQIKALPTVVVCAPLLTLRLVRGQSVIPSLRLLCMIVLVAAVGQLGGNVGFQWALGEIGLALCVPLTLGAMIVSGGILGSWVLNDRVSRTMFIASGVLILAICILSCGAPQANASIHRVATEFQGPQVMRLMAAVTAACLAGVSYSVLGVALRLAANRGMPISSLLFTVGLTGFLLLGVIVQSRLGELPWSSLRGRTLVYLLGAGTFNVIAFAALTKALHLSSLMFVNALNASQTAMAAVIGVLLFKEAFSWAMFTGVVLTAVGLLIMRGRRPRASDLT